MKSLLFLVVALQVALSAHCSPLKSVVKSQSEIDVGNKPNGLTLYEKTLYVALQGEESIALFDVSQSVPVNISRWEAPGLPFDVVVDSRGERLAFSQNSVSSVSYYTIQNGRLGGTTSVPKGPTFFAFDELSDTGYLTSVESSILISFSLETQEVIRSYRTGVEPYFVALSRFGRSAFVTNKGEDTISIINLVNGLSSKISLASGTQPTGCAITNDYLLVTSSGLGTLLFINATDFSIDGSLAVGSSPSFVDTSDDGNYAFVANTASGTVTVVDLALQAVLETITVGSSPTVVRSFENKIYVSNEGSGTVSVVELDLPSN